MGGNVAIIARIGDDTYGKVIMQDLKKENMDVNSIRVTTNTATGTAFILVEENGENRIILAPGANAKLSIDDIYASKGMISSASMLVLQLEVPFETVKAAIDLAYQMNIPVLLNPAPAIELDLSIYPKIGYLVVNETEASILSGKPVGNIEQAKTVASHLLERGIAKAVIVTLGSQGVVFIERDAKVQHLPALQVQNVVDTTAAGDTFIGAFVVGLLENGLRNAVEFGISASAVTITRQGAQSSIPRREQVSL